MTSYYLLLLYRYNGYNDKYDCVLLLLLLIMYKEFLMSLL